MKGYLLSIICVAFVCGIVSSLVENGFAKDIVKLICGLFMTFCILQPLYNINWDKSLALSIPYQEEASQAAEQGQNIADEAMAAIIKEQTEAYILDKAAAMNAKVSVSVILSENLIPVSASVGGTLSPYMRQQLSTFLETEIGITKENQEWTG